VCVCIATFTTKKTCYLSGQVWRHAWELLAYQRRIGFMVFLSSHIAVCL